MCDIDVRFLFATNRNLEQEVEEGKFRNDLYFRVNVFRIAVPPLRDRVQDIPELSMHFLKRYTKEINKDLKGFSEDALQSLQTYEWPGNVRELQNAVERAVVLSKGSLISTRDLGIEVQAKKKIISFNDQKKRAIVEAMQKSKGNISQAARLLGVTRRTIYKYLKKYNLETRFLKDKR